MWPISQFVYSTANLSSHHQYCELQYPFGLHIETSTCLHYILMISHIRLKCDLQIYSNRPSSTISLTFPPFFSSQTCSLFRLLDPIWHVARRLRPNGNDSIDFNVYYEKDIMYLYSYKSPLFLNTGSRWSWHLQKTSFVDLFSMIQCGSIVQVWKSRRKISLLKRASKMSVFWLKIINRPINKKISFWRKKQINVDEDTIYQKNIKHKVL